MWWSVGSVLIWNLVPYLPRPLPSCLIFFPLSCRNRPYYICDTLSHTTLLQAARRHTLAINSSRRVLLSNISHGTCACNLVEPTNISLPHHLQLPPPTIHHLHPTTSPSSYDTTRHHELLLRQLLCPLLPYSPPNRHPLTKHQGSIGCRNTVSKFGERCKLCVVHLLPPLRPVPLVRRPRQLPS